MRAGFVLDLRIWMGCLQSSVILRAHTQIKKHVREECLRAAVSVKARVRFTLTLIMLRCLAASSLEKVPQPSRVSPPPHAEALWQQRRSVCFNPRLGLYEHVAGLFLRRLLSAMTRTPALWISGGCSTLFWTPPEATVLIQTNLIPRHAQWCPCASLGMSLFCCRWRGGGGVGLMGAVGDGHPDYASSYGLFTTDTKRCGKQQHGNLNWAHWGVGLVSSYNFGNRHVFLWSLTWPGSTDQ